jgi:hypothetical protein
LHPPAALPAAIAAQVHDGRAMGSLIPSRTLGDFHLKHKVEGAVIAVPEVVR